MKKVLLAFLLLGSLIVVFAHQPNRNPKTKTLGSFHSIKVSGGIDLYLSYGNETVTVDASKDSYRDNIKAEVKNGVLQIWYDGKFNNVLTFGHKALRVNVSYKTLDSLIASGGSDIRMKDTLNGKSLSLFISAGSDFKGAVNLEQLKVQQKGGADVNILGHTQETWIDVSGGSDFKGFKLIAENCFVNVSGGSDVHITVNKSLKAEASSGSDIRYKGLPAIQLKKSASSDIKNVSK